jgi:hypothetical protein
MINKLLNNDRYLSLPILLCSLSLCSYICWTSELSIVPNPDYAFCYDYVSCFRYVQELACFITYFGSLTDLKSISN